MVGKLKLKLKLKADFHIHTWEDPYDSISYDAYYLLEAAAERGYKVLSITNHSYCLYHRKLRNLAEKLDILLIPGVELSLQEGHVILLFSNPNFEYRHLRTLSDLNKIRSSETLVIAPHPFFPISASVGSALINHPEYFDAIEYTMLYLNGVNFNKKAQRFAKEKSIPLIGVGDVHKISQMDSTYTLLDAQKNPQGVFSAIRENRVEIITRPLPWIMKGIRIGFHIVYSNALE